MALRDGLSDKQWAVIEELLPKPREGTDGRGGRDEMIARY